MGMSMVEVDQVKADLEFIQFLGAHIIELICDPNVFKTVRAGYYPEEKERQIEYFLKNTFGLVYAIAIDKKGAEQFAADIVLKSFPKDVREGKVAPTYEEHHKEAKAKIMEYYNIVKDDIEKAREEGRISF